MTGAWAAINLSTRVFRTTIPGRPRGGSSFDSDSSKLGLGAVSGRPSDITDGAPVTSRPILQKVLSDRYRINEAMPPRKPRGLRRAVEGIRVLPQRGPLTNEGCTTGERLVKLCLRRLGTGRSFRG